MKTSLCKKRTKVVPALHFLYSKGLSHTWYEREEIKLLLLAMAADRPIGGYREANKCCPHLKFLVGQVGGDESSNLA